MLLYTKFCRPGTIVLARALTFKNEIYLLATEDELFNKIVFFTITVVSFEDNNLIKYKTLEGYIVSAFKDDDNEIIRVLY